MFRKPLFALVVITLLVACSSSHSPTPAGPITKTDGLNHVVTLEKPAQRIVSLAPSNTEILFAIGAGAQGVGRDESSDYPAEATSLPTVGGWSGFSTESIVALQPDLVLGMAGGFNTPELAASLEQLGLTVYYLPDPTTLEEVYANIETVGELTGHATEAHNLVESLKTRVAAVAARITTASERPSVYFETSAEPGKSYSVGPGSFIDWLLTQAGGTNAAGQLDGQWLTLGFEEVIALNPQVIILADANWGESAATVAARPGWGTLQAVQQGKIYPVDDNLFVRPGPRLVDGLEVLAKLLHPDLFK